jgi:hypothetical protein
MREQNKANAHLIAAAPDMYEALEAMVEQYDNGPDAPILESAHKALTAAKEALTKARGES